MIIDTLNTELISLIEEVLGIGKASKKDEVLFYCPVCNHRKRKLSVNLNTGKFHCWVCEYTDNTRGKSLFQLFKKFNATQQQFDRLKEITNDSFYTSPKSEKKKEKTLALPKEFISLKEKSSSIFYRHAMAYLKKRSVDIDDIVKYNLGYCEEGKYRNRIIIPSYDESGKLNYFTGRSFIQESPMPYLNPPVSKNIVGFELFINWQLPVIICEGPYDAIAIKRNVIPLFGKTIGEFLKAKIMKENVQDIYISLDTDAIKNSLGLSEYFMEEGRNVFFVRLDDKDPGEIGQEKFFEIVENTNKMSFTDLMKFRMM